MSFIRLLHMSDAHFCTVPNRKNLKLLYDRPPSLTMNNFKVERYSVFPSSYIPEVAEGAARFVLEAKHSIDRIVISGDLATSGLVGDLSIAYHFVKAVGRNYISGKLACIGFMKDKIFLLPGNHDRFYFDGSPGSANFDVKFNEFWTVRKPNVVRNIVTKGVDKVALIAADFSLTRKDDAVPRKFANWLGQGKAHFDVLQSLVEMTKITNSEYPDVPVIWVLHFPPIHNCPPYLRLIDMELVIEAANDNSIAAIMSGHLHQAAVHTSKYGTKIICAGSMCCCEDNNLWLHYVDVYVGDGKRVQIKKTDFRWSDEDDEFSEVGAVITVCGL